MPLFKGGQGRFPILVVPFDERPEIIDGGHVGLADTASAAGLDRHIAQGHACLHGHPVDDRAAKLNNPVGCPVDPKLADHVQNHVLGIDSGGQFTRQIDTDRGRLTKGTDPLEDADFEIGGSDAGGKGSKSPMGTGMTVAHDYGKAGPDIPLFGKQGMADAVTADVEKVLDLVTMCPIPQHFGLQRGLAVLGGGHMVDDRLDLGIVVNPVLTPPDQISNGHGGGDLVTQNPVEIENLGPGKGLVS